MPADLATILAEHGVRLIKPKETRTPWTTCAEATLENILRIRKEPHLRDLLALLRHSENNGMALVGPVIKAVSNTLYQHREWYEADASAWLELFDRLDLGEIHAFAKRNKPVVPADKAIATVLLAELERRFGTPRTPSLFDSLMETCP